MTLEYKYKIKKLHVIIKTKILIMIKFFWFSFVCCGVANGVIYSQVAPPEKYVYMGLVLLICFILVVIYRHFTRHFVNDNKDYDENHSPIFIISSVVTIIVTLIALIAGFVVVSIGLLTAGVGFVLSSIRESEYA